MSKSFPLLAFLFVTVFTPLSVADEGLWLFNAAPKTQIKEKYGFDLTDQWLDHVRLSSVRLNNGGSGSFVSPNGLVLTNHHVGAGPIQDLSTPDNDLLVKGFYAKTQIDELPCKGIELNVLMSIEDVTPQVKAAIASADTPEESEKARKETIAKIEKDSLDRTGFRSDVLSLFQGGLYHLYRYKKYTDVRLVFAPEQTIASFGGDPDNYEYPRYCLDCAFFRVYENGEPAKTEHYLKWNNDVPKTDELVFVSGHPGTTNRAYTTEHLEFQRDVALPWMMQKLYRREVVLSAFAARSEENARRATRDLDAVKNYRKRYLGQLLGLQSPPMLEIHAVKEIELRKEIPDVFTEIEKAVEFQKTIFHTYDMLESASAFNCKTFQIARTLIRYAEESQKPNGERLPEYRDSAIESLKHNLFSDAPIFEDLEILKLADSLSTLVETNPEFATLFGAKNPKERAVKLIQNSKVRDVDFRKKLFDGGLEKIEECDDPMIRFAAEVDGRARGVRKTYEENVDEPLRKAYTVLAEKRFEKYGTNQYPDATFTLRLSYGTVSGYTEDDGTVLPPFTTITGLYERADSHKEIPPFDLPPTWRQKRGELTLTLPMNVVTTTDTVGGNSGSPMVNTSGEIVGLLFDGNIQSPARNFIYTDSQARSVSVHTAVIAEALRKVYEATELVKELGL